MSFSFLSFIMSEKVLLGLGDGPWLHMRGGYADTYICAKNKQVVKLCDKYHAWKPVKVTKRKFPSSSSILIIHYSTICDLVFSKAFEKLRGFPTITNCELLDSRIRIDMDYLGKTLHDACQTYSLHSRWKLLPKLIEQVSMQCMNLLFNGVQHTDLKPGNILIDENDDFHVIDFNCMSTELPPMKSGGGRRWSLAIGTYNYIAPEILFSGRPHETSMVWSIGIVALHWILGHYPISDERMVRYLKHVPTSQHHWKKLFSDIRHKYSSGFQLEKSYIDSLHGWWKQFQNMLKWNPYRRWTLQDVLQVFHQEKVPQSIHVKQILYHVDPTSCDPYARHSVIEKGFTFLEAINMEHLIASSVMLFDKSYPVLHTKYPNLDLLFLCCWTIQGYLSNQFLFDTDMIVFAIYQHYGIQCNLIIDEIYSIGLANSFDMWQKEWYTVINEIDPTKLWAFNGKDWNIIKQILIGKTSLYNSVTIANDYLALTSTSS